jgi:hypothetical protein
MNNLRQNLGVGAAVFMAALMVLSVGAAPVAAQSVGSGLSPNDITAQQDSTSVELASSNFQINSLGSTGNDVSIIVELDTLENQGVDLSGASASATAASDNDNVQSARVVGNELRIVADDADTDGNIDLSSVTLSGLDTSDANVARGLTLFTRIDDSNAGNFDSFSADVTDDSGTFDIGFVELLNDGSQDSVYASVASAIDNVDGSGDWIIRAAETTYTFDENDYSVNSNADSLTIEPAGIAAGNVTLEDDGDGSAILSTSNAIELTLNNVKVDTTGNNNAVIVNAGSITDLTAFNSTFVTDGSGDTIVDVLNADVGTVNLTDSKFTDGSNSQTALDVSNGGTTDVDLVVDNNTFRGLGIGINANADITLPSADISDNTFENNNQHVKDSDEDDLDLTAVLEDNNNEFDQYAVSQSSDGTVGLGTTTSTYSIYGDFDQTSTGDVASADDATVLISEGDHTTPGDITIGNSDVTFTSPDGAAVENVSVTVDGDSIIVDEDAGDTNGEDSQGLTVSGISFDEIAATSVIKNDGNPGNVIDLTVSNNEFLGATGTVIDFDSSDADITDTTISSNVFDKGNEGSPTFDVLAVSGYSSEGSNSVLTVSDNTVANSTHDGSEIFDFATVGANEIVQVQNNNIELADTGDTDVFVFDAGADSAEITVDANTIDSNDRTGTGIDLTTGQTGENVAVTSNEITNTSTALDVSSSTGDADITGNTFGANAQQIDAGTISDYSASDLEADNAFDQLVITSQDDEFQTALDNDNVKNSILYGSPKPAIEAVDTNGDTVFVAPGTYVESTAPTIRANDQSIVSLEGAAQTTIEYTGTSAYLDVDSDIDFSIDQLTINSTDDGSANADVKVSSASAVVDVNETVFTGPGTSKRLGINIQNADTVSVRDTSIDTYDYGVIVEDSAEHAVNTTSINNTNTAAIAIRENDAQFNDITVTNSSVGIDVDEDGSGPYDGVIIRNSNIASSSTGIQDLGQNGVVDNTTISGDSTGLSISESDVDVDDATVTTAANGIGIDVSGSSAEINTTSVNADDIGIDVQSSATLRDVTVTASAEELVADGTGVNIASGVAGTVRIQDSEVSDSETGVIVEDTDNNVEIVRNQILNNSNIGVEVLDRSDDNDEVVLNFNDIVDNNVGIDVEDGNADDFDTAFANYYGAADGPSGTVHSGSDVTLDGSGDEIAAGGGNDNIDDFLPFLTQSVTELPEDELVVVTDERNIFSSGSTTTLPDDTTAEVVVAGLNDTAASNVESQNVEFLTDLSQQNKNPDDATAPTAANPIKVTFQQSNAGDYEIEATQVGGTDLADSVGTQSVITSASGVELTSEASTVTADGTSQTNVTAQLTDGEGNVVGQSGVSVSFDIRSNQSEAGASLNQTSATTDSSGQATAALTAENASFDVDVRAIASGQQSRVTITVEEAQEQLPDRSITFDDKTVGNTSTDITVESATFNGSQSFNVVVHEATRNDDGTVNIGQKIGESVELDNGTQTDITVNISKQVDPDDNVSQLTESQTLVAMLHTTNTSDDDGIVHTAPIREDGTENTPPVFDDANITVSPLEGTTGDFDSDGDGELSVNDVGDAASAFIDGDLSIQDISRIAAEFIN